MKCDDLIRPHAAAKRAETPEPRTVERCADIVRGAILLVLLLAAAVNAQTRQSTAAPRGKAVVKTIVGEAFVRQSADGQWAPLRVGARVHQGWHVSTGEESSIEMLLSSGLSLRIEENGYIMIPAKADDAYWGEPAADAGFRQARK